MPHKSSRVGHATLNNGVGTTAYRAVVQHECAQCAGTITPGALFSRRAPRALLTATGAKTEPICIVCRPLRLDSAGDAD